MKVRIKFQKYGSMKFIGHLDVMRYFQKAFRRAEVDSEYSKGFSPHQIMSFAAPLGVGLTSDGEYVDIQLLSSDSPEIMIERMNAAMTEGFRITGFHFLKEREENQKNVTAMALVSSADYLVSLKDGYPVPGIIDTKEKFRKAFEEFYQSQEIIIDKKTKNSEKAVDIKPMITLAAFDEKEYQDKLNNTLADSIRMNSTKDSVVIKPESVADRYENGIKLYLQLDTGSAVNLKPELVMEAFCSRMGIDYQNFAWQVHRIEVYTRAEENKLIPLDRLER